MKVIVLNDKSDLQVRFDLFERLNTGGIRLTHHEVREAVYMGEFVDLLSELSNVPEFQQLVHLPKSKQVDGTAQDFVLRFFAFHDRYRDFDHSVIEFLNDYCAYAAKDPRIEERRERFVKTFRFLVAALPDGIRRRGSGVTPVNLFEGVAVGAALALDARPGLKPPRDVTWIASPELRGLTTGATNDRRRVIGRIEFCRDEFLEER